MVKLLRTSKLQKLSKVLVLALSLSLFSCGQKENKDQENGKFTFGVWTTADAKKSDADYSKEFKKYKDGGIDEVLINTNTDPKLFHQCS